MLNRIEMTNFGCHEQLAIDLHHDGTKPDLMKDLELFARLAGGSPIHASPLEHQAMALDDADARSRNFKGWLQHREWFEGNREWA